MLMSRLALSLALLTSAICSPIAALAGEVTVDPVSAPVNDKPADAVVIGAKQLTVEDSLKNATGDAGTPLHGKGDLRTVWYKIPNADPGSYVLALNGISDGAIGVWLDPLDPNSPGEWIKLKEDTAIPVLGGSDKISVVGFSTALTGKTLYIQVGNPKDSAKSAFSLEIFRLGPKLEKPFVVIPQNRAVVGLGAYNGSMGFGSAKRHIINIGEMNLTMVKSTTLPSSGVNIGDISTLLPPTTAMLATVSATGGGPRFGETGQWEEKLTFTAKSGNQTLGSTTVPVKLLRAGEAISGPSPILEMTPNGGTAKMGDSRKLVLKVTNRSSETMRGCSLAFVQGNEIWVPPHHFTYKQINLSTGKVIGNPNRIFNVKSKKSVRLDIAYNFLRPTASELLVPLMFCAETADETKYMLGESTAFLKTYVNGPANAKVSFPGLTAPRAVAIAKNASKTISVSVKNNGPKRKLTLLGMNSFYALNTTTPISFKFCADQAGSCAKDPITSMKVTFEAGETRKFLVKVKRNNDAISSNLATERGYVMVYEGDKYVSMAGFGVKPK